MAKKCEKLDKLMECQREVIQGNIDNHLWFNHITDREKGAADFIKKYGGIMREMYCGYACELRDTCEIAKKFKKSEK